MGSNRRKVSKDKTGEELPSFMLDAVPVLSGPNNTVISNLGSKGVSSNPYPSMARPRKSFSSLYSQSDRDLDYERERETRSVSSHLPAPAPLFQSSSNASLNSANVGSGRSTPSSIRRLDPSASPISNDGSSHHTQPSICSIPGSIKMTMDPSSSPGGASSIDSGQWRSGRYNGATSSRNAQKMTEKPLPSEPKPALTDSRKIPPSDNVPKKSTPNLKSTGFSHQDLQVSTQMSAQTPSTPQLSHPPMNSALSPSSHVAPRSRNASGQHVVYPNPMLSVFWKASDPAEWTMDRVVYWLEYNKFGPDWIDTFRTRNLHGGEFLSLVSYQKLKSLGPLSTINDIYDTRPSRFIHILRKVLDKSSSSTSNNALGGEQTDDLFNDDLTNTSSTNILRPMRSEYTLEYSNDAFTRTAVNTPVQLPVRNKSLEDLQELDPVRVKFRNYKNPIDSLRPISTYGISGKSQVCKSH